MVDGEIHKVKDEVTRGLYTKLCQWFLFLMKKFLLVKYRSKMNGVKVPFYWILSEI